MKRVQWISGVILMLLGLAVGYLAMRNRQPPILPADVDHSGATGTVDCLTCHSAEGGLPRDPNHPLGDDCFRCHGRR